MSVLSAPRPGTLSQLLGTSRPLSWINTAYPFAAAYLLAGGGVDTRIDPVALHHYLSFHSVVPAPLTILEGVKKEFPWISYGDLWTLAGVASIQEMGGPKIPWRPGRIDGFAAQATPDGRLPDASQGSDHLRRIFGRMGFNDQEIE